MSTRGLKEVHWNIIHGVKQHQTEAKSNVVNVPIIIRMNLKKKNKMKNNAT